MEAALEHFLSPAPSVEDVVHERFDDMDHRFDRLEHDIRMMAETIALHARYHLSVMPPLPPVTAAGGGSSSATNASRFLPNRSTGAFDRTSPLMQETIERLNSAERSHPKPTMSERDPKRSDSRQESSRCQADVDPSLLCCRRGGRQQLLLSPAPELALSKRRSRICTA